MANRYVLTPFFLDQPLPALESLAEPGWQLVKPALPSGVSQRRMSALHGPLATNVAAILQAGDRPVIIAGDCCATIGVTAGIQRAGLEPILIWLDAHGDFNTWETSPSGFLGGMPLAMLVGRGEQTMPDAVGMRAVAEQRVILTDGRDLDPREREAILESKLTHLTDVNQLLEYPLPDAPIHVHFDVDVLDPSDAPAMSYLAPGGPSADELMSVFRHLADTGRVKVVSVSSWNPALDPDSRTQALCMQVLGSLIDS